ncbi:MafI family immunity protein [Rahnella perminowiae]|uniref:MafI family immunity protein n=1 Tax=Rahnella perminowiae TaxID=2816244 RepID=A0ABS6L2A8_9GAMM|nr:MafI family immunity protein [Rahnella perminowiae]MBU9835962.1 MafI family immunity protein [Rahnella perminowiae]
MFSTRIIEFGNKFRDRLNIELLDGALDYINFNEENLAFEILCDHIAEYDVVLSQEEFQEAMILAKDMGFNVSDGPYKHMQQLVK